MGFWGNLIKIGSAIAAPFTGGASLAIPAAVMGGGQVLGEIVNNAGKGRTPSFNPNAKMPTAGAPTTGMPTTRPQTPDAPGAGAFNWQELMPYLVGGGLSLTGNILQSRAQGQQNQALRDRTAMMDKLAEEERKRREYYASIVLPSLLQAVGNQNPQVLNSVQARQRAALGG